MKNTLVRHDRLYSSAGFSLIELALGMAIVGMVLGGALLIGGKFWEVERVETNRESLHATKVALLDYARQHGRLPLMDWTPGDGHENSVGDADNYVLNFGLVPYLDIDSKGKDFFGNPVQYFVNWQLTKGGGRPCQALKNLFLDKLDIFSTNYTYYYLQQDWDVPRLPPYKTCWIPLLSVQNKIFPVAAVLISPGTDKAFNSINISASFINGKNFKENDPDDIVVYISLTEAYEALSCR